MTSTSSWVEQKVGPLRGSRTTIGSFCRHFDWRTRQVLYKEPIRGRGARASASTPNRVVEENGAARCPSTPSDQQAYLDLSWPGPFEWERHRVSPNILKLTRQTCKTGCINFSIARQEMCRSVVQRAGERTEANAEHHRQPTISKSSSPGLLLATQPRRTIPCTRA